MIVFRYALIRALRQIKLVHYLVIVLGLATGVGFGLLGKTRQVEEQSSEQSTQPKGESVKADGQQSPLAAIKDALTGQTKELQEKLRSAQLSESAAKSDLGKTKSELEKTRGEKKQLEEKVSAQEKTQAQVKEELEKTKTDLTKTQKDLGSKKTELEKLTKDLTARQAEIDKAKRGLALFDNVKSDLEQYQKFKVDALNKSLASISAQNSGNFTEAQSLLEQAATATKSANSYNDKVQDTISKIKTGNY